RGGDGRGRGARGAGGGEGEGGAPAPAPRRGAGGGPPPPLTPGPRDERPPAEVRAVGDVVAHDAEPARQPPEHAVGGEAMLLGPALHPTGTLAPFVPTGERFEGGEGVARPADGRHQRPQGGPEIRPRIRTVRRRRGQRLETVEAPGIEEVPEQARVVGRDELAPGPEPPPLEAGGRGRDEAGPAPLPH